jgi:beta-mannanase
MIKYFFIFVILSALTFFMIGFRGVNALKGIVTGIPDINPCLNVSECRINVSESSINYGVYDPEGQWSSLSTMAFDHEYVQFNTFKVGDIKNFIDQSKAKNRWLMITVEPYVSEDVEKSLLDDIQSGQYDLQISTICSEFSYSQSPVFIRFAHEMEKVTGRYPWAVNDSESYISAYKHFVDLCKIKYANGFYVWSPAGDKNLASYYPGDEFVDYVGVSVYSLPEFDVEYYGNKRSFSENFGEKYERVKNYQKPVIIAELGVTGSVSDQITWMKEIPNTLSDFPLLKTIVYYNSKDNLGAWEDKYGVPDWRLDETIFEGE